MVGHMDDGMQESQVVCPDSERREAYLTGQAPLIGADLVPMSWTRGAVHARPTRGDS